MEEVVFCPTVDYEVLEGEKGWPPLAPATPGSSGIDLRTMERVCIPNLGRTTVGTGVRLMIPKGFDCTIRPRSSMTIRGVIIPVGTVDADYRGELRVVLFNMSGHDFYLEPGDRIAQMVFTQLVRPTITVASREVFEVAKTYRGVNGFGSTGIA